jgi:hypothetical protein
MRSYTLNADGSTLKTRYTQEANTTHIYRVRLSYTCMITSSWYNYSVRAAMPKGTHNRDKADYLNDRDAVYRLFSGYPNANMAQVHARCYETDHKHEV